MRYLALLVLLAASVARANSLDTFTFFPQSGIPSFTVPSTIGPQFSLIINSTEWNFLFTDGDHFGDVDYSALYVSTGTQPVLQGALFDFPYYCAPWASPDCIAVGKPWNGHEFVPGDYISMTIIIDQPVGTPEPGTAVLEIFGMTMIGLLAACRASRHRSLPRSA
jgi:hypothetical protein